VFSFYQYVKDIRRGGKANHNSILLISSYVLFLSICQRYPPRRKSKSQRRN